MEKKIDGRKNNGGHRNGGKKPVDPNKKKLQVPIFLSKEEFSGDWKPIVLEQFEKKMVNKLNKVCDSNK